MSDLPTILQTILQHKQAEVRERQQRQSIRELQARLSDSDLPKPRGFVNTIRNRLSAGQVAVIAEIKKASPSKGIICEDFIPETIAKDYVAHGATCLSVLTDERFFMGHDQYLQAVHQSVDCPVLRKDFTIDAYQIYEARLLQADCILLIAACLTREQIADYLALAVELGLDALVEIHTQAEWDKVCDLPIQLLGINNRNLHTFKVDLAHSIALKQQVPDTMIVVCESGIHQTSDVATMRAAGIATFLVGEAFMKTSSPGAALHNLFNT